MSLETSYSTGYTPSYTTEQLATIVAFTVDSMDFALPMVKSEFSKMRKLSRPSMELVEIGYPESEEISGKFIYDALSAVLDGPMAAGPGFGTRYEYSSLQEFVGRCGCARKEFRLISLEDNLHLVETLQNIQMISGSKKAKANASRLQRVLEQVGRLGTGYNQEEASRMQSQEMIVG